LRVDTQGNVVVIELKRERLEREVVAQAIDYESDIASWDGEKLDSICRDFSENRHALAMVRWRAEARLVEARALEPQMHVVLPGETDSNVDQNGAVGAAASSIALRGDLIGGFGELVEDIKIGGARRKQATSGARVTESDRRGF